MRTRRRERGLVMLDVLMAGSVLTIAVLGTMAAIPSVSGLQESSKQREEAYVALLSVCEEIQQMGAAEAFREFNQPTDDDPDGPGTGIGPQFQVGDLVATSQDGFVGHVRFPVYSYNESGKLVFSEQDEDPTKTLGMPRDLDGDGKIKVNVPLEDLELLPIRITIDWTGPGGVQHIEAVLLLNL